MVVGSGVQGVVVSGGLLAHAAAGQQEGWAEEQRRRAATLHRQQHNPHSNLTLHLSHPAAALGGCNMGSCDSHIFIAAGSPDWNAYCAPSACVSQLCPPNAAGKRQALSNIEHAVCVKATGDWQCVNKLNAPFAPGPVCPPPAYYAV